MEVNNAQKDGYWGNLTPEQEIIFSEFKIGAISLAEDKLNYDINKFDNYDFCRFLRARKFDLKKALDMFEKYLRWRIDAEVDTIFVFSYKI